MGDAILRRCRNTLLDRGAGLRRVVRASAAILIRHGALMKTPGARAGRELIRQTVFDATAGAQGVAHAR